MQGGRGLVHGKVDIHPGKTQFSRLVELAPCGEEIIIAKAGQPVARLVPYETKGIAHRPGAMRGNIRIKKSIVAHAGLAPSAAGFESRPGRQWQENFDEPLSKELLL